MKFFRTKTDPTKLGDNDWIPGMVKDFNILDLFKEYMSLVPWDSCDSDSPFFRKVSKKRYAFEASTIGKNSFDSKSKAIAVILGLPNPNTYTTHTYRRSAGTIFFNLGIERQDLQLLGDWKDIDVPLTYVKKASISKRRITENCLQISPKKKCRHGTK